MGTHPIAQTLFVTLVRPLTEPNAARRLKVIARRRPNIPRFGMKTARLVQMAIMTVAALLVSQLLGKAATASVATNYNGAIAGRQVCSRGC